MQVGAVHASAYASVGAYGCKCVCERARVRGKVEERVGGKKKGEKQECESEQAHFEGKQRHAEHKPRPQGLPFQD